MVEGKGLYNILDLNNEITHLASGKVGISRKFSESLEVNVGNTIYWHIYTENKWHEATVDLIYRSSETQGITFLREDFEVSGEKYTPSMLLTNKITAETEQMSFVNAVHSKSELKDAYAAGLEIVNVLVVIMIAFSAR